MTDFGEMGDQDPIEAAFAALRQTWEDQEAHKQFIGLCVSMSRLHDAGRLYREYRERAEDDADKAVADRQLARVLAAAMANLDTLPRAQPKTGQKRMLYVAAGTLTVLLWSLFRAIF